MRVWAHYLALWVGNKLCLWSEVWCIFGQQRKKDLCVFLYKQFTYISTSICYVPDRDYWPHAKTPLSLSGSTCLLWTSVTLSPLSLLSLRFLLLSFLLVSCPLRTSKCWPYRLSSLFHLKNFRNSLPQWFYPIPRFYNTIYKCTVQTVLTSTDSWVSAPM